MKRTTRLAIIGCLHTTVYLILLPRIVLPLVSVESKNIVKIAVVALTVLLTITITRLSKNKRDERPPE